jgi:hypothetical protein
VHRFGLRDKPLADGVEAAARELGDAAWRMVTEIPALVLEDEPVEAVIEAAAARV